MLCSVFSVYCGLLYNDFTSLPMYLFGNSCYSYKWNDAEDKPNPTPTIDSNCVYPFGMDPAWYMSTDELTYLNSFKMKLSVILGVVQMVLGICMRGSNALYFKKPIDFFFEFVPMLLMMVCLFGFMDLLIVLKWLTNYTEPTDRTMGAPSIITSMIVMGIQVGDPGPANKELALIPMGADGKDWTTQTMVMHIMMLVVVLCVPLMLFVKPIVGAFGHKADHHKDDDDFKRAEEDETKFREDDDFQRADAADVPQLGSNEEF